MTRELAIDCVPAQGFDMLSEQLQDNLDEQATRTLAGLKHASPQNAALDAVLVTVHRHHS